MSGGAGPVTARRRLQKEADDNLANHFESVQTISDATTLPQMLEELERHLNRAASMDALILRLRCAHLVDDGYCAVWYAATLTSHFSNTIVRQWYAFAIKRLMSTCILIFDVHWYEDCWTFVLLIRPWVCNWAGR